MKKYVSGVFALALAVGFSAFTSYRADVTLYFSGDPLNSTQVANESLWREDNSTQNCQASAKACAIMVDHTFLSGPVGSRTLNTSAITLNAIPGASGAVNGYVPEQDGGNGFISEVANKQ